MAAQRDVEGVAAAAVDAGDGAQALAARRVVHLPEHEPLADLVAVQVGRLLEPRQQRDEFRRGDEIAEAQAGRQRLRERTLVDRSISARYFSTSSVSSTSFPKRSSIRGLTFDVRGG